MNINANRLKATGILHAISRGDLIANAERLTMLSDHEFTNFIDPFPSPLSSRSERGFFILHPQSSTFHDRQKLRTQTKTK